MLFLAGEVLERRETSVPESGCRHLQPADDVGRPRSDSVVLPLAATRGLHAQVSSPTFSCAHLPQDRDAVSACDHRQDVPAISRMA
jgi:hypothetical protein